MDTRWIQEVIKNPENQVASGFVNGGEFSPESKILLLTH